MVALRNSVIASAIYGSEAGTVESSGLSRQRLVRPSIDNYLQ